MEVTADSSVQQYVVFKLGRESYGIDIHKVTTIEKMVNIARVPKTPDYIKGVINLRGEIIPVMDIRKRFSMGKIEQTEETRIIILKASENTLGIIVDEVDEVIQLKEDMIEKVTDITNDISLDYISGVGRVNDGLVTLLNLKKLISELLNKNE